MSPLSIVLLSPVKKNQIKSEICTDQAPFASKNCSNMSVDFDVRGQQWIDFFTGGSINMNMDWYFSQNQSFKVKNILIDLFLTNMQPFASQNINWWTGVVWFIVMFYQLFGLSFWRHPFTAEDPTTSDVMLHFSKSVQKKKPNHLHPWWPEGEYIFSIFSFLSELFL